MSPSQHRRRSSGTLGDTPSEGALRFDSRTLNGVAADQSSVQVMACAFGLPGNRSATPRIQNRPADACLRRPLAGGKLFDQADRLR